MCWKRDLCRKTYYFCPDILEHDNIHEPWHPRSISYYIISWPVYQTGPYYWLWPIYRIPIGFHGTFGNCMTCQKRTFTSPDTWSSSIGGSLMFWTSITFLRSDTLSLNVLIIGHDFITDLFMSQNGIRGYLVSVPSIYLWRKSFNLGHNFWTVRNKEFIFGTHTQ